MKYHLRRTQGAQIATYEELGTLQVEIETCLNSRPICALPNDPHTSYLSPGHFLIGEPLTQLPTIDFTNIKMSRLTSWETFQQQLQNFWKRWSADYIHELQHRQRSHRSSPNLQPVVPVILREDNTAPLHWPTAVITDVHPGADGKTRVVTVNTSKGTFKRPIIKLCPLPHVKNELQFLHLLGVPVCSCKGQIVEYYFCRIDVILICFNFDLFGYLELVCIYFNVNLRFFNYVYYH